MASQTEAACLFETGTLYGRRILLDPAGPAPVFAGFKPGAFSLYFGDAPIFHFDREGRWHRAFIDGLHYLRSLDGTVQTIDRVREGENLVLHRRTLGADESAGVDERIRIVAEELLADLDSGRRPISGAPPKGRPLERAELSAILARISAWDMAAWTTHRSRYQAAYGPLPWIPPDCQSPLVLQATVGQVTGGVFAPSAESVHLVRSPEEFQAHAHTVAELLGRRVEQCRSVFLGGSDVLLLPADDVAAYLETIGNVFPVEPAEGHRHPDPSEERPHRLDGVQTFLDRFDADRPSVTDLMRFRALSLTRVCLGLDTITDDGVLHDPSLAPAIRNLTSRLKQAGLGVGVAVPVVDHDLERIVSLLNEFPLGQGDLIALLDPEELGVSRPTDGVPTYAENLTRLRTALDSLRAERKVKVVPYSMDKRMPG